MKTKNNHLFIHNHLNRTSHYYQDQEDQQESELYLGDMKSKSWSRLYRTL